MQSYSVQAVQRQPVTPSKTVYLIASGDLRQSANEICWAAQQEMESPLTAAVHSRGLSLKRAHQPKRGENYGFFSSQRQEIDVLIKRRAADEAMLAKAAMAERLGRRGNVCGPRKNEKPW